MRAKTTFTTLALTAAATAAMAGPANAAATKTSISIQVQSSGVFGFVKSSKSSCHSGRKVTVYRKVSGPDKKAGSDIAQPNQDGSQYSVGLSRAGKYYAKVTATSKCKGATSTTKSFTPSKNASEGVAAQSPPKTRTSVRRSFRSNGDIVFSGTLKRSKKANVCPGRGGTARLYRSRLSDGRTTKVDTSTISTKGTWEVKDNRPGRYLVIVTATGCARAYSPSNGTWLFDPPNPAVPKD